MPTYEPCSTGRVHATVGDAIQDPASAISRFEAAARAEQRRRDAIFAAWQSERGWTLEECWAEAMRVIAPVAY